MMTYERYKELGGTADEMAFDMRMKLTEAQFLKLSGGALPDEKTLELCVMLMLNAYEDEFRANTSQHVSSVSNDGVSVSYARSTASGSQYVQDALAKVRVLFCGAGIDTRGLGVRHLA